MTELPSTKDDTTDRFSLTGKAIASMILATVGLFILTFPEFRPGFSPKIDPQIHWVFNYLWINDFAKTQQLIFPHGPLTFINFPLAMGKNLFWGIALQSLFRLAFIGTFFYLTWSNQLKRLLVNAVLLFFILEFFHLEYIFVGLATNCLLIHRNTQKTPWFLGAIASMSLGFYIKMSIGIMSLAIIVPYIILSWFDHRRWKPTLLQFLSIPLALAAGWLLLYQNLNGLGNYFTGVLELTSGNSDSASTYPDNNWWLLAGCGLTILTIPLLEIFKGNIRESKTTIFIYLLLGCCTFAVWKHSMAREDPWHIYKMFSWLFLVATYLFALNKKVNYVSVTLSGLALFLFYVNIKSTVHLFVLGADVRGIEHFSSAIFKQQDLFDTYQEKSKNSIESYILTPEDLATIGRETVDCYPIDYSFIARNQLNFQPRPVIQSYAAYTPWLDAQNAIHFTSVNAPRFLIWETDVRQRDTWGAELTSIDNHYLLNDEPQTIQAILANYTLINKGAGYLLFERKPTDLANTPAKPIIERLTWDNWIGVPIYEDGLLFAKLQFEDRLLKWMKAKLYKDDPLFIEYALPSGEIRKHRISKRNAEQGIWINPFIHKPSSVKAIGQVQRIRFSTGNPDLVQQDLRITWEHWPINKKERPVFSFQNALQLFGQTDPTYQVPIYSKSDLFEGAVTLAPKSYSLAYKVPWSVLKNDSTFTFVIAASVRAKMGYHAKGNLVISLEQNGKKLIWKSKKLTDFMKLFNRWELAAIRTDLPESPSPDAVLKVYVWNSGKEEIAIKDLKIEVFQQSK